MKTDAATLLAFGLAFSGASAAAPTYSCFNPPDEGQTNPLGEGFEDVTGSACCEALIDESDMMAGRNVVWDPVNCNHGPGETAITEEPLCRAHDTDGCRFCHDSCDDVDGLCITCDYVLSLSITESPTPSPTEFGSSLTEAPFGIFPETPTPTTSTATTSPASAPTPSATPSPTVDPAANTGDGSAAGSTDDEDCECVGNLSDTEIEILVRRAKTMRCDPSCSDGSDPTWGVLNCDYFGLGQNCRTCSDVCDEQEDGTWLDSYGFFCKPCSAIP